MGCLTWVVHLAFVQTLAHGVYVAMNGRYFKWDNVEKQADRKV